MCHASFPLFFITTEFATLPTLVSVKSILFDCGSMQLYVPHLALKPGESHRPLPITFRTMQVFISTTILFFLLYVEVVQDRGNIFFLDFQKSNDILVIEREIRLQNSFVRVNVLPVKRIPAAGNRFPIAIMSITSFKRHCV